MKEMKPERYRGYFIRFFKESPGIGSNLLAHIFDSKGRRYEDSFTTSLEQGGKAGFFEQIKEWIDSEIADNLPGVKEARELRKEQFEKESREEEQAIRSSVLKRYLFQGYENDIMVEEPGSIVARNVYEARKLLRIFSRKRYGEPSLLELTDDIDLPKRGDYVGRVVY